MPTCVNCGSTDVQQANLQGFCASCADPMPTGRRFGPKPPCHTDSCSFAWRDVNTTSGQIVGDVQIHEAGGLECVEDVDGSGVRVRTNGGTRTAPTGCVTGQVYRDPITNQLWIEQGDIEVCDCDSGGGCQSTAPGGDADQTHTGCAGAVCARVKNTHCSKPMTVRPSISILGAELIGGQATYEVVVGGTAYPVFTAQEPKVAAHTLTVGHDVEPDPNPAITITHTGDTTLQHNVTRAEIASYSGTIQMPAVTIQPGETFELCANPRIRYRNADTGTINVTWGAYSVCLTGTTACSGNGGI
jgi:hypothetical protein